MKTTCLTIGLLWLVLTAAIAADRIVPVGEEEDYTAIYTSNLGTEKLDKGDYAGALKLYTAAIHKNPKAWLVYYNRAGLYMHQKQYQLALQDCNSCVGLRPSFFVAVAMRAQCNEHLGNYSSSLADYNRVLSLHPQQGSLALTLSGRAWLLATCPNASIKNPQQAVKDAKAACNVSSWGHPDYIDTLAMAYAASGDFDSAVKFEEKAISKTHDSEDLKGMERRLAMFKEHHGY